MLRKTLAALVVAGAALTSLASPATAGTPAQSDLFRAGGFMAAVQDTTSDHSGYTFTQVTFGRAQQPDGSMVALASYYESGMRDGLSYSVSGSLVGAEASAAYRLAGLDGGELEVGMPVQECVNDWATWQETCTSGTRQVTATVTTSDGAPISTHRVNRSNGCHLACWSSSVSSTRREAAGTVVVDGVTKTTDSTTASVGRYVILEHMLWKPTTTVPTTDELEG